MNNRSLTILSLVLALLFMTATVFETSAFARAGGGRSFGSSGSRSYSPPSRSYQPSPSRNQFSPGPSPYQPSPSRQQSGSFLRSLGGGLLGGFLGGMLFRGLGFGSSGWGGGHGGGGIGLFEILLLCGIGYLIYRFVKKRRQESASYQAPPPPPPPYQMGTPSYAPVETPPYSPDAPDLETGLSHIRQMDASFDEDRFRDQAMDLFFRIQGAWMNRDLAPVTGILTDEMRRLLQDDVDRLLREKRINRLENIAVRNTDLVEAWQESGQDFLRVRFYANLLDYTTDEAGAVVEGNRTEPVKFEEYWTFTRPVGAGAWRLSAIAQA